MKWTHAQLLAALDYNPVTGRFIWRHNGEPAGKPNKGGYLVICFGGKGHYAHRLAWYYVTGAWPLFTLDHVNGIRDDNSVNNLRQVTAQGNAQNSTVSHSKSGLPRGVTRVTKAGTAMYKAQIRRDKVTLNLGTFATIEEAATAYTTAKEKFHTATNRTDAYHSTNSL